MARSNAKTKPGSDISRDHLRLWIRLLRTTRAIESKLRNRLRNNFGATLPRFDVLAALYRHPEGMRMGELSRSLMVSNGNVTPIVETLVQAGLVLRSQGDGDRRSLVVRLTGRGREEFSTMAEAHRGWVDELLGELDPADTEQLARLLGHINPDTASHDHV